MPPMRSARSGSTVAPPYGRCARCAAPATRTTCRCSRVLRCRSSSPMRPCRRCRSGEQVVEDYRHLHLSLKAHPVSFLRAELDRRGIVGTMPGGSPPAARHGRRPGAGAPAARQRPGRDLHDARGRDRHRQHHRVAEGVRDPSPVVLGARLISVTGKLQNEQGVIHVVAHRLDDLSHSAPPRRHDVHRGARPCGRSPPPDRRPYPAPGRPQARPADQGGAGPARRIRPRLARRRHAQGAEFSLNEGEPIAGTRLRSAAEMSTMLTNQYARERAPMNTPQICGRGDRHVLADLRRLRQRGARRGLSRRSASACSACRWPSA